MQLQFQSGRVINRMQVARFPEKFAAAKNFQITQYFHTFPPNQIRTLLATLINEKRASDPKISTENTIIVKKMFFFFIMKAFRIHVYKPVFLVINQDPNVFDIFGSVVLQITI